MIPTSVEDAFAFQLAPAIVLKREVDQLMGSKPSKWFYDSRIKRLESFAQKIESGKVQHPTELEDFFAAMLVVPMAADIPDALAFVQRFFSIAYRRPVSDDTTSKRSSEFPFDDLRLYGTLSPSEELPPRPIDHITFEIQVKTFLQHAWSIATHDLVYKFDRVSWARSRVAYQVKALLEHAELSIHAIEEMERASLLPVGGEPEGRQQQLIEIVSMEWSVEFLPADRRRLAMNLDRLLTALDIETTSGLLDLLALGKEHYGGEHPLGWSPYQCVVDYSSIVSPAVLSRLLTEQKDNEFRIFVTPEILSRLGLSVDTARFALQ